MANVLTVVARIRAAKGNADALAALLSEQAAVVRSEEPGCLFYRVHRSTKDPELFLFYEMYVDDAAPRPAPQGAAPCRLPTASREGGVDGGCRQGGDLSVSHRMTVCPERTHWIADGQG